MRRGDFDELTPREREVWALMAEGLSNRGIAERVFLGRRGVEKCVREVLWKVTGRSYEPDPLVNRRVLAVLAYSRQPPGIVDVVIQKGPLDAEA